MIKSAQLKGALDIRSLQRGASPSTPDPLELEFTRLRDEEIRLQNEVARLRRELESAATNAKDAFEAGKIQGFKEGQAAGMRSAEEARRDHMGVVTKTAADAVSLFERSLQSLERLAPQLSVAALEKVFGGEAPQGELVKAIIAHRLQALAGRGVVRIEVAQVDFNDPEAATSLRDLVARQGAAQLHISETLPRGACRIHLQFGAVEVGAEQQWKALKALLERMAEEEG